MRYLSAYEPDDSAILDAEPREDTSRPLPPQAARCRWCGERMPSVGAFSRDLCSRFCSQERYGADP